MASNSEDEVPQGYAYAWSKANAEKPLDDFLKQVRCTAHSTLPQLTLATVSSFYGTRRWKETCMSGAIACLSAVHSAWLQWIWAVRAAGPAFPSNLQDCISEAQDVGEFHIVICSIPLA